MNVPFSRSINTAILGLILLISCGVNPPKKILAGGLQVEGIRLPPGFAIQVYAENVVNAPHRPVPMNGLAYELTDSRSLILVTK